MSKIIHIQRFTPNPEGSGGHHRIYQNYQDLIAPFGVSEVGVVTLNYTKKTEQSRKSYYINALSERFSSISLAIRHKFNPPTLLQALLSKSIESRNPFGSVSLEPYIHYVEKNGKPDVCIVDYPTFIELARYNKEKGIVTVYCSQNIESFSNVVNKVDVSSMRVNCALQWAAELEMLNLCQERLMISLSETSMIRGLGLSAIYYPYFPVNEIRSRLMRVRQERANSDIERGLFLMVGSVFHAPTGDGFRWFLRNVKENGLPDGMHIIVGGKGGDNLMEEFGALQGVEIRGRLEQAELDGLMKKACAMLIPQRSGFGSVTRISEMACAGFPVITSEHAIAAMQAPPGVRVVSDEWHAWESVMQAIVKHPQANTLKEYEAWEDNQPKPLTGVLGKYL